MYSETHEIPQCLSSLQEPKQYDQARHAQQQRPRPVPRAPKKIISRPTITQERKKERGDAQEIAAGPPEREDEKGREDQAGDFARVGVEPARDECGAD